MSLSHSAAAFIKARGLNRTFLYYTAFCAAMFIAFVYLGARQGAGLGAAIGVGCFAAISGPLIVYLAVNSVGGSIRDALSTMIPPILCGVLAYGVALAAAQLIPSALPHKTGYLLRAGLTFSIGTAIYLPLIRAAAPEAFAELLQKLRPVLGPLKRFVPAA
jgi:hypothetical protein